MTIDRSADVRRLLDQLDALHAKATPGPWTVATAPAEGSDETPAEYLAGALDPESGRPLWVAWAACHRPEHDDLNYVVPVVTGDGPGSEANAKYLALVHDALPALTAALRAVLDLADERDAVARRLREAAAKPGRNLGQAWDAEKRAYDAEREAERIRAAVAALADAGEPSPTTEKAS